MDLGATEKAFVLGDLFWITDRTTPVMTGWNSNPTFGFQTVLNWTKFSEFSEFNSLWLLSLNF